MKKNVLIIVLVILVLGLGGYLVYDKVLSNEPVNEENKIEEKEYDLTLAKQLVDKYASTFYHRFDAVTELSEQVKTSIALYESNRHYLGKNINCKEIPNVESYDGLCTIGNYQFVEYTHEITYDDLNKMYKYLFGKDTDASKISTDYAYYDANTNNYYIGDTSSCFGGIHSPCVGGGFANEFGIKSANIQDNILTVILGTYNFYDDEDGDFILSLNGQKWDKHLDYNEEEIQRIFNENKDNVYATYRWTFKQEDNRFVLQTIEKI